MSYTPGELRPCRWKELHQVYGAAEFEYVVEAIIQADLHDVEMPADQWDIVIARARRQMRAAPDLLTACELALSELEEYGDWCARELNAYDPDGSRPRRASETMLIRAIAKARGDE